MLNEGRKNVAIKVRGSALSEYQECADLARWMSKRQLLFTHIPMGGTRRPREAAILKAIGAHAGVPDFLVFSPPPATVLGTIPDGHDGVLRERARGIAIEMKRVDTGRLSAVQAKWRDSLRECGWVFILAHGAKDAIQGLEDLGF